MHYPYMRKKHDLFVSLICFKCTKTNADNGTPKKMIIRIAIEQITEIF